MANGETLYIHCEVLPPAHKKKLRGAGIIILAHSIQLSCGKIEISTFSLTDLDLIEKNLLCLIWLLVVSCLLCLLVLALLARVDVTTAVCGLRGWVNGSRHRRNVGPFVRLKHNDV